MAPRNQRLHRAYSSRPTASRSRPRGASSSPRNRPNSANAALAAAALRARSSAREPSASRPSTSLRNRSVPPSWPVHRRTCAATSPSWRRADTWPRSADSISVCRYSARACGTAASRALMLRWASSPSVGIRSRTPRTFCIGPAVTETWLVTMPASYISTLRPRRSTNASWATRSRSSTGVAARTSARTCRSSSARPAKPVGERSGSRSSWPAMPAYAAIIGSRAAASST